jgi:hypothetical protein
MNFFWDDIVETVTVAIIVDIDNAIVIIIVWYPAISTGRS